MLKLLGSQWGNPDSWYASTKRSATNQLEKEAMDTQAQRAFVRCSL